jgi:hypothetical protein
MKKRQFRSNQGRNPKKECETQKLLFFAIVGLVLIIIYLIIK